MKIERKTHNLITTILDLLIRECLLNKIGKNLGDEFHWDEIINLERKEIVNCVEEVSNHFKINEIYLYQKEIIREINFITSIFKRALEIISSDENTENNKAHIAYDLIEEFKREIQERKKSLNPLEVTVIEHVVSYLENTKRTFEEDELGILISNHLKDEFKNISKDEFKNVSKDELGSNIRNWIIREHHLEYQDLLDISNKKILKGIIRDQIIDFEERIGMIQKTEQVESFDEIIAYLQRKIYYFIEDSVYGFYPEFIVKSQN